MPDPLSGRRPEPDDLHTLLPARYAGLELRRLGAGADNVAHALGDRLLVRCSLIADPAERRRTAVRDRLLLDLVGGRTGVHTPTIHWYDDAAGVTVGDLVTGDLACDLPALDAGRFGASVGAFLRRLHAIDIGPVRAALTVWQPGAGLARAHAAIAPHLAGLPAADRERIETFLREPAPAPRDDVLVHDDLGEDHLFVDPGSGRLSGVIDWSDAGAADPARDFALLLFDFGEPVLRAALAAYGSPDGAIADRARWYAVRAGIEGLAHRLATGQEGDAAPLIRIRDLTPARPPGPDPGPR